LFRPIIGGGKRNITGKSVRVGATGKDDPQGGKSEEDQGHVTGKSLWEGKGNLSQNNGGEPLQNIKDFRVGRPDPKRGKYLATGKTKLRQVRGGRHKKELSTRKEKDEAQNYRPNDDCP